MDAIAFIVIFLGGLLAAGIGYVARDYASLKEKVTQLVSRGEETRAEPKRLNHSEIAFLEDALAILTDIRIRDQVEKQREEAVSSYKQKRIEQLAAMLGAARNNGARDYPTDKPANRPDDYDF